MSVLSVVVGILALIAFISFLDESIVEAVIGQLFDKIPILTPYKWTQIYIAYAVGIAAAFIFKFDLIYLVAQYLDVSNAATSLSMPNIEITIYGMLLTGFCIGRGSNFVHKIYSFLEEKVVALRNGNGKLNDLTTPLLPLIESTTEPEK